MADEQDTGTSAQAPKLELPKFTLTATETVTRKYVVQAADEKDARKRLNLHWHDPDLLREGVVVAEAGEEVSARRTTKVEQVKVPPTPKKPPA